MKKQPPHGLGPKWIALTVLLVLLSPAAHAGMDAIRFIGTHSAAAHTPEPPVGAALAMLLLALISAARRAAQGRRSWECDRPAWPPSFSE